MRVARLLKILRFINLAGLEQLISSIVLALPSLAAVLYICTVVIYTFAVIGVDTFMGTFSACRFDQYPFSSLVNATHAGSPISDWIDCRATPNASWVSSPLHFDNIFNAMEAVIACFLIEGWLGVLNDGLDADGVGKVPRRMASPLSSVFFIFILFFGSFFLMRLFVASLVVAYDDSKKVFASNTQI